MSMFSFLFPSFFPFFLFPEDHSEEVARLVTQLELNLDSAHEENRFLADQLADSKQKQSQIQGAFDTLSAEKAGLSDQYFALVEKDGKQRSEIDDLSANVKRLLKEKHTLVEKNTQLTLQLGGEQEAHQHRDSELIELRSQIDRFKVTCDRHADEKRDQAIRLEDTKVAHAKCEAESAAATLKLATYEKDLEQLKKERDRLAIEHSGCREQISGLKAAKVQHIKDLSAKCLAFDKLRIECDLALEQKEILTAELQKIHDVQSSAKTGYDSPGKFYCLDIILICETILTPRLTFIYE